MTSSPLSSYLTQAVLSYLNVPAGKPDVESLDTLLAAYTRTVPWESIFRIVKRATTADTHHCPRWPDEFWDDAIKRGGGGTCFESNYAFFSLLLAMGYEGYLTINDMENSQGDHSAIVLTIDGAHWLVDVGIPIYVALPIDSNRRTQRTSLFHTYRVVPHSHNRYLVKRDRHPRSTVLFLIDEPVADVVYRDRVIADYAPETGLFLDRVVIQKVIAGRQWYFNSGGLPRRLEEFYEGTRIDHLWNQKEDLAEEIAQHFRMDEDIVKTAIGLAITRAESISE